VGKHLEEVEITIFHLKEKLESLSSVYECQNIKKAVKKIVDEGDTSNLSECLNSKAKMKPIT